MHTNLTLHRHICTCTYVHLNPHTWPWIAPPPRICARYLWIYIHVHNCVPTNLTENRYICTFTYVQHTYIHIHMYIHMHVYIYIHACIYIYAYEFEAGVGDLHHARAHTHTHTHTQTLTHTHTRTRTHKCCLNQTYDAHVIYHWDGTKSYTFTHTYTHAHEMQIIVVRDGVCLGNMMLTWLITNTHSHSLSLSLSHTHTNIFWLRNLMLS